MIYDTQSDHYFRFLKYWQTVQKKWNEKYGDTDNPTVLRYGGASSSWNFDHVKNID